MAQANQLNYSFNHLGNNLEAKDKLIWQAIAKLSAYIVTQQPPAAKVPPQDPQIPILTAQVESLQHELNDLRTQVSTPTVLSAEFCCPGASHVTFIHCHA